MVGAAFVDIIFARNDGSVGPPGSGDTFRKLVTPGFPEAANMLTSSMTIECILHVS